MLRDCWRSSPPGAGGGVDRAQCECMKVSVEAAGPVSLGRGALRSRAGWGSEEAWAPLPGALSTRGTCRRLVGPTGGL